MTTAEPTPTPVGKPWYKSRTIWVMTLALVATLAQMIWGFAISPDEELAVVTVIGLALRAVTKEPLV